MVISIGLKILYSFLYRNHINHIHFQLSILFLSRLGTVFPEAFGQETYFSISMSELPGGKGELNSSSQQEQRQKEI
jgi:hypothetical protein